MPNENGEEVNNFLEGDEEDDVEQESVALDLAGVVRDLFWRPWDPGVSELHSKKQDGELILQPVWQRDFVWNQKKASKLIESVLINVPLPVVYLSEDTDGALTVIDGQQRLTSLISFIEGKFPKSEHEMVDFNLTKLTVLPELSDKKFSELDRKAQRKIKNTPIHCIVIEASSHPDIKFEIFERLNTGAEKLNDDELRNSIYRGPYIELLKELAASADFQFLLNNEKLHKRMKDRGMVLRFLTFWNKTYLKYKSPAKQFLNHEINENKNLSLANAVDFRARFHRAIEMSKLVFSKFAFRRYILGTLENPNGEWLADINIGLFDVVMHGFADYEKSQIVPKADAIREELIHLMSSNDEFIDSITLDTSKTKQIRKRFEIWNKSLTDIVGYVGEIEPRSFSFSLKKQLFEDEKPCAICGQTMRDIDDTEVDHIEHYWRGGKTIPENARLTHRYCNRHRGGRN